MSLSLDHLVIHVKDLQAAIANYQSLGFTVQIGGTHADGNTHNALVGFADGSYLELIAFLHPTPNHRWSQYHTTGYEGFVDYALLPDSVGKVVHRVQAQGLAYQGPFDGGRVRPDGEKLVWQIGTPPTPELPFLCGDITARALRVREGDVRIHPNGAQGIASLTLLVRHLADSVERYQILLDSQPSGSIQFVAGLGVSQLTFALGHTDIVLISPTPDSQAPAARELQRVLSTRGEGVLGATLKASSGASKGLPLHTTHGALFDITTT